MSLKRVQRLVARLDLLTKQVQAELQRMDAERAAVVSAIMEAQQTMQVVVPVTLTPVPVRPNVPPVPINGAVPVVPGYAFPFQARIDPVWQDEKLVGKVCWSGKAGEEPVKAGVRKR